MTSTLTGRRSERSLVVYNFLMSDLSAPKQQITEGEKIIAVTNPDQLVFIVQNIIQLIKELIGAALLTFPVWFVKFMNAMSGKPQAVFVHPILSSLADVLGLSKEEMGDYVFVGFFAVIFIFAVSISVFRSVHYIFLSKSIRYALTDRRIICLSGPEEKKIWSLDLEEIREAITGRGLADWLLGRQTETITLRLTPRDGTNWVRYPAFIRGVKEVKTFSQLITDAKNARIIERSNSQEAI